LHARAFSLQKTCNKRHQNYTRGKENTINGGKPVFQPFMVVRIWVVIQTSKDSGADGLKKKPCSAKMNWADRAFPSKNCHQNKGFSI
jgi:hypothetical protein